MPSLLSLIKTPWPLANTVVLSFYGQETYCNSFIYQLELSLPEPAKGDWLKKIISWRLNIDKGHYFRGVITKVCHNPCAHDPNRFQLKIEAAINLLKHDYHSRRLTQLNLNGLLEQLTHALPDKHLRINCQANLAQSHWLQYQQSTYDFILQELNDHQLIHYYLHDHDSSEWIVAEKPKLNPWLAALDPLNCRQISQVTDCESLDSILSFEYSQPLRAGDQISYNKQIYICTEITHCLKLASATSCSTHPNQEYYCQVIAKPLDNSVIRKGYRQINGCSIAKVMDYNSWQVSRQIGIHYNWDKETGRTTHATLAHAINSMRSHCLAEINNEVIVHYLNGKLIKGIAGQNLCNEEINFKLSDDQSQRLSIANHRLNLTNTNSQEFSIVTMGDFSQIVKNNCSEHIVGLALINAESTIDIVTKLEARLTAKERFFWQVGQSSLSINANEIRLESKNIEFHCLHEGATVGIARMGDQHTCPMVYPNGVPHLGGAILQGADSVYVNGQALARVGDSALCEASHDFIAQGAYGLRIEGQPASYYACTTEHGGIINSASTNVNIATFKRQNTPEQSIQSMPRPTECWVRINYGTE